MRIERISGAILILLSGVLLLMAAYQRRTKTKGRQKASTIRNPSWMIL